MKDLLQLGYSLYSVPLKSLENFYSEKTGQSLWKGKVKHPKARRLSVTIRPDGQLRMTVPYGITEYEVQTFLSKKVAWIERHVLQAMSQSDERKRYCEAHPLPTLVTARRLLKAKIDYWSKVGSFRYSRLSIRRQRTRWGSCTAANQINLNLQLLRLPDDLIDYVVLHELVHTKMKNHRKGFWLELQKWMPDARPRDRRLKMYGFLLSL